MDDTKRIAQFTFDTGFGDLPAEVIERQKIYALDTFASGIAGAKQPWSDMIADVVDESGSRGPCSLFARPWKAGISGASLINGGAIGAFETDHASVAASGHPAGTVFPAALATAEARHSDGRSLITALALGYEVVCRVGEAATRAVEDERGFHGPSTNGPFGAAAAVGKLLGLDTTQLTHALGIAGSHSSGLLEFAWEGAMTKRLHLGRAAQLGAESALLASRGFTGPTTVLEGKYGFLNVFSPSPQPERLLAGLGEEWLGQRMFMKPYACHGSHEAVITSIVEAKEAGLRAADIAKVTISGGKFLVYKHDDAAPTSIMGAQYSVIFGAAIAFLRDIENPYVYSEETLWDPEVRDLASRIEAVVDDRFASSTILNPVGDITVVLNDGTQRVLPVTGFRGLPQTPFDFEDSARKLRVCAEPYMSGEDADRIIKLVQNLEDLDDVADLAALVGA